MKKYLLASLGVFVAWAVLDFVIHGLLLMDLYTASAALWRPMEEMNMGMTYLVNALVALAFTGLYVYHGKGGGAKAGAKFGLVYGLATGLGMGFGTFLYMPIPYALAWGWFLASVVKGAIGGWIAGKIAG
jgi:hypothetical protein